ncbi:hypothetical protein RJ639_036150 [Escallonia herrerae]|uniref:Bet v I/Major latex protein domain-containing protein n=1 Tax=Escallonia herrerae TaxID=1293975 RepID=A0AA89B8I6_9ASTE|nr:hypothetical protein RJ639_036150 [Escallonia herrerae]
MQMGKEVSKQIIEAIDMENKTVVYKLIEGDVMELYKSFTIILHVDTKGEHNLVTWTFENEKMNEGIQDPTNIMDFLVKVTKDIETHHLQQRVQKNGIVIRVMSRQVLDRSIWEEETPLQAWDGLRAEGLVLITATRVRFQIYGLIVAFKELGLFDQISYVKEGIDYSHVSLPLVFVNLDAFKSIFLGERSSTSFHYFIDI